MNNKSILYDLQLSAIDKRGKFLFTVDSNVNVATFTCNNILKERPDWTIYVLVPYPSQITGLTEDNKVEDIRKKFTDKLHPNIKLIPYRYANQPFRGRFSFETESLKWQLKDKQIDLVYCNDPCKVMNWKVFFWSLGNNVPIISRNHWITGHTHRKVPTQIDFVVRQVEAGIYGDLVSFNSQYASNTYLENAREHFNSYVIHQLKSKVVWCETVDLEKVDKYKPKKLLKKEEFWIVWAHRLSYYTGWEKTLEVLSSLYDRGFKFKVFITDQGEKINQLDFAKKYPFMIPIDKSKWNHKAYVELLWNADLVIGYHQYPASWGGLAITEAMAANCVPLLYDDYAYKEMMYMSKRVFFRTEKELEELIAYYILHERETDKIKLLARKFVEKELSMGKYIKKILKDIEWCIKKYENIKDATKIK